MNAGGRAESVRPETLTSEDEMRRGSLTALLAMGLIAAAAHQPIAGAQPTTKPVAGGKPARRRLFDEPDVPEVPGAWHRRTPIVAKEAPLGKETRQSKRRALRSAGDV